MSDPTSNPPNTSNPRVCKCRHGEDRHWTFGEDRPCYAEGCLCKDFETLYPPRTDRQLFESCRWSFEDTFNKAAEQNNTTTMLKVIFGMIRKLWIVVEERLPDAE
jgi:hypothetical protein